MFDMLTSPYTHPLKRLIWMRLKAGARAVWDTITGNPVSFSARSAPLRQLSIAFSPQQDLHGYDSPWPAGGGKNKLSINSSVVTQTRSDVTMTVNRNSAGDVTSLVFNGTAAARTYFVLGKYDFASDTILNGCPTGGNTSTYLMGIDGTTVTDYGSGSNISTPITQGQLQVVIANGYACNNLTFKPMVRLASETDASYSPYSNICPISGWDSLTVEQRGKNLFNIDGYRSIDPAWTLQDGVLTSTNNSYKNYISQRFNGSIGTITVSFDYSVTNDREYAVQFFDVTAGSQLWRYELRTASTSYTRTSTLTDGHVYEIRIFGYGASSGTATISHIQLARGATASDYVPYNPLSRSISISLGETVYSGWVDVISGVGEVTMASVDMGSLTWRKTSGYTFYLANALDPAMVEKSQAPVLLCSRYGYGGGAETATTGKDMVVCYDWNTSGSVIVFDSTMSAKSATEFKAAMSGTQLVYPLATHIPISLTPQEVQSLLGVNVLFSDANGNLTVEYRSN